MISYIDQNERVLFINATAQEWLKVDPTWAKGKKLSEVFGEDLYLQRKEHLHRALTGEQLAFDVVSNMCGVTKHLQASYIPDRLANGEIRGVFALSMDVTPLKLAELELQRLVLIDSLTGLPNRRYFEKKLVESMVRSRRTHRSMALMFLDIDFFKQINDSLGHGAGDQVLMEFARRISNSVRGSDFAARLAGDEFVIILEDLNNGAEVTLVADKVLQSVRQPMQILGSEIYVTTSMGIAVNDSEDLSSDALIHRADKALYVAKGQGRNQYAMNSAS